MFVIFNNKKYGRYINVKLITQNLLFTLKKSLMLAKF